MALVTVQRSPTTGNSPQSSDSGEGGSLDDEDAAKNGKSLSECYFAGKGAAVVLAAAERSTPAASQQPRPPDIQAHLQSMFYLLSQEETLKMAVKLESAHAGRTRYLVVVSRLGKQMTEESCLLGIDCNHTTTVGLVLRVLADTSITLDGDGGFSVSVAGRTHIFKPVSVQAMWSALQTLHKVSAKARTHNYFLGGVSHEWVGHYEASISSDRSCLNEWHAMDSLESRRPPSPDCLRHKPVQRGETENVIRSSLKEIMMSVDLDEVTSKQVRSRLEESLNVDLAEYKPFIDQEMLTILGQMDEATEIFPHVYLGSEWNASNLEELTKNGVCHILNVTREIDNFFPGMFDYLNVRVYDDEKTDLLKHWDDTFKYITKAKKAGSKVLVHCKMGVSRSASVVIAYAMKAYSWDLKKAITYVQNKRNCIKPNSSFIQQLETYQGILDAMKNREKLQRSKSETNLKRGSETTAAESDGRSRSESEARVPPLHSIPPPPPLPPPPLPACARPKSWSPDHATANNIFTAANVPFFPAKKLKLKLPSVIYSDYKKSLYGEGEKEEDASERVSPPPPPPPLPPPPTPPVRSKAFSVRMPCSNGLAYSVSPNKIIHLSTAASGEDGMVRSRVTQLEGGRNGRKGLVLHLTRGFEADLPKPAVESEPVQPEATERLQPPEPEQSSEPTRSTLDLPRLSVEQVKSTSDLPRPSTAEPDESDRWAASSAGVCRHASWGSGDARPSPEPGIVKNLKREFEAKSKNGNGSTSNGSGGSGSLPSSPVSERSASGPTSGSGPTASLEDLSHRKLVNSRSRPPKAPTVRGPVIPTVAPTVAPLAPAAAVVASAVDRRRLQQGRTHPLARLAVGARHPNKVYNTM